MVRRKLKHFEEMKKWDYVFELTINPIETKGTWGKKVILELACGGGEYTVALAEKFPDTIFVGVDIKGARMWRGASLVNEKGIKNARFLRVKIENLDDYFAEHEVDEIWITFPNPHPTRGNEKRRLTSPRFLGMYKRILKNGGKIHLKTDSDSLFAYSLTTFEQCGFKISDTILDVYANEKPLCGCVDLLTDVQTTYEKKYLKEGRKIKYLKSLFET